MSLGLSWIWESHACQFCELWGHINVYKGTGPWNILDRCSRAYLATGSHLTLEDPGKSTSWIGLLEWEDIASFWFLWKIIDILPDPASRRKFLSSLMLKGLTTLSTSLGRLQGCGLRHRGANLASWWPWKLKAQVHESRSHEWKQDWCNSKRGGSLARRLCERPSKQCWHRGPLHVRRQGHKKARMA